MKHLKNIGLYFVVAVFFLLLPDFLFSQPAADIFYQKADSLRMQAQFESAKIQYQKAETLYQKAENWPGFIRVGIALSRMDLVEKQYDAAEKRTKALIELADQYKIQGMERASCYNLLGAIEGEYRNDFRQALQFHRQALEALDTLNSPETRATRARTIGTLGVCYINMGDFAEALQQYKAAVDSLIAIQGPMNPGVSIGYSSMAEVYQMRAEYNQAIAFYQKALDIQLKLLPPVHPLHLRTYREIGTCFAEQGKFDQASDYFQLAEDMATKLFGPQSHEVAKIHHKLGQTALKKGDLNEAKQKLNHARSLTEVIYGPKSGQVEEILADLSALFTKQENYAEALALSEQAIAINQAIRPEHPAMAMALIEFGRLQAKFDNGYFALEKFETARSILEKAFSDQHPALAVAWLEIGKIQLVKGDALAAEVALEKALEQLDVESNTASNPISLDIYTEMLNLPGKDFEFKMTQIQAGIKAMDQLMLNYHSPGDQAFWATTLFPFFERCLEVLYENKPQEAAFNLGFQIAEKSKAALLRRHLHDQEVRIRAGIPDQVFEKEGSLRRDIRFYTALLEQPEYPEDEEKLKLWQNLLREARSAYIAIQDQLQREYPDYYELKYQIPPVSLDKVRKMLALQNASLVEYFEGTEAYHIFGISSGGEVWLRVEKGENLKKSLDEVTQLLNNHQSEAKNFYPPSRQLYQSLLEPILKALSISEGNLIILPDGQLHAFPFEILCQKGESPDNWKNLPYLMKTFSIQYAYYSDILLQASAATLNPSDPYVGFAPSYTNQALASVRSKYGALPFAKEEVASGHAIWKGRLFLDTAATKNAFLSEGKNSRILHLAMHTDLNSTTPALSKLLFQDIDSTHALHTFEIYDLRLANKLAILSACETGAGQIQRGEGIYSLARAFQYAGVPAIAMSLWKVSDQPTKVIITDFLKQLKEGKDKSDAMQQAKLNYLSQTDQIRAHPYYWAGLVILGDKSPVKSVYPYIWLLIVLPFVLVIFIAFRVYKSGLTLAK